MMATSQILLGGSGSASDVRTQSGRPYFLLAAARNLPGAAWQDLDLDIRARRWAVRRYAWNIRSLLSGRGTGGYQFTDAFLERLWKPAQPRLAGHHILTWMQIYPSSVVSRSDVEHSYFIDQTLSQLFEGYGVRQQIRDDIAEDALRREAEGYRAASVVIVQSEWTRRAVMGIEGVDPQRLHVVVPGANLDLASYRAWSSQARQYTMQSNGPLRLVFVGRHPMRKGLDRLLRGFRLARKTGAHLTLDVIGARRAEVEEDLREVEGVVWHGFIDKAVDTRRFLEVVSSAHVGCLLSRAEAGGIGLREFHALGLAVIGPEVGGSPDYVFRDAAILVSPTAPDRDIADLLTGLAEDRARVSAMRDVSWQRREEAGWPFVVQRLRDILG